MQNPLLVTFPAYTAFAPRVPVHCVTPGGTGYIHRFYDSSPFSPSGRYMALTRLPFEDRQPRPGEPAEIAVVDLVTGGTRTVAETRGWDVQLGAQVQWGADDHTLLYNDLDPGEWIPYGVRLDPVSGERRRLGGTVYAVSPDGRWTASPCLRRTASTQAGYGVVVPRERIPVNRGAPPDDGIYLTDLDSGESRLLASIDRVVREAGPAIDAVRRRRGDFYGFHVKWNPQGTRLMFVLRWLSRSWLPWKRTRREMMKQVMTLDADGGNARVAVSAERWARGGHHPNWCPDGERVLMNLNTRGDGLRFARLPFDGSSCETLVPEVRGSGHPTLHPDGRHLLTDVYLTEKLAFGDGTVPIRLVDLESGRETTLLRIRTRPDEGGSNGALRVDPHPAWDRSYTRIAFNACPNGQRQVFVADLGDLVAAG
jgi:Tol biopolymer transport system component